MTPALLLPLVVVAAPQAQHELDRAIAFFQSFEDGKAAALLRDVVARRPSGPIAAKAHLYLGLIALNAIDPDRARIEFKLAIEFNPLVELPPDASPKAHFTFDQARQELAQTESGGALLMPAGGSPAAPVAATSAPAVETEAAPHRSHTWTWVLVGTAVAFAAVAAFGGYEIANYQSMKGAPSNTYSYDAFSGAYTQARFWNYGWPAAAGLAAAAGVGGVFAW